ncbi:TlpA family protein disulfide reductase [Polaribacter uvawellassae]|uniref:TlpA family protein disulfide reductase n=1 Tax=Polaribacter uvawellassae TaxID=3133495 RepID=UPI00321B73B0
MNTNRKFTWVLFLSVTVIFVFFGTLVVNNILKFDKIWKQSKNNKIVITAKNQKVLNLKTNNNEYINLSEKNKFIHYWATWCKPCVRELKQFDSLLLNKRNYSFYFISDEEKDVVQKFLKKNNFTNVPFYLVNPKDNVFEVDIYPTTFYKKNKDSLFTRIVGVQDWTPFFEEKKKE